MSCVHTLLVGIEVGRVAGQDVEAQAGAVLVLSVLTQKRRNLNISPA